MFVEEEDGQYYYGVVKWNEKKAMFQLGFNIKNNSSTSLDFDCECKEVTGNIYEDNEFTRHYKDSLLD